MRHYVRGCAARLALVVVVTRQVSPTGATPLVVKIVGLWECVQGLTLLTSESYKVLRCCEHF
jgi:hypothetical protein